MCMVFKMQKQLYLLILFIIIAIIWRWTGRIKELNDGFYLRIQVLYV